MSLYVDMLSQNAFIKMESGMPFRVCSFVLLLVSLLAFSNEANGQVKFGAIGDSLLDEHSDQTEFGQSLDYSMNAYELMATTGRIDPGATGTWGGTRGNGYEYNWALAGATTGTMISDNQHTNLANQIGSAGITKAVMVVGSNNLFPLFPTFGTSGTVGSEYENVYEGFASPAEIAAFANAAVAEVRTAAQLLKGTGVDLVVATAPEYGIARLTRTLYPDPVKRERVNEVYELYNALAIEQMTKVEGVTVVDLYGLSKAIWGENGAENQFFEVGGVNLNLAGTGGVNYTDVLLGNPYSPTSDTVDVFVHDGIHPNTAISGVFANLYMTAFNQEHGDSFQLFTEEQILLNAGPTIGGMYSQDTLVNSLGGRTYSDFVFSAVPEPNSLIMLSLAGIIGLTNRRRRT